MSELKQLVRDRFDEMALDARQLQSLTSRLRESPQPLPARGRRVFPSMKPAAVASVALLVLTALAGLVYDSYRTAELVRGIAQEVATNHLKLKPLEIESADLDVVLGYFDELDFQLVASPRITGNPGDRLLGGRYCTIRGIDAAQLRVASADGELSTWYEATLPAGELRRLPAIDQGDDAIVIRIKGLEIRLWREHGIAFAEARAPLAP